jgi:hypothetical protein
MSLPRDFLTTLVTPTVIVGPLACTFPSVPEHEDKMIDRAKADPTTKTHHPVRFQGRRLFTTRFWVILFLDQPSVLFCRLLVIITVG